MPPGQSAGQDQPATEITPAEPLAPVHLGPLLLSSSYTPARPCPVPTSGPRSVSQTPPPPTPTVPARPGAPAADPAAQGDAGCRRPHTRASRLTAVGPTSPPAGTACPGARRRTSPAVRPAPRRAH